MAEGPPAALAAFLGEAPSAAALRRPSSGVPSRRFARGCGEDSSPDTPGLPCQDGGFDDCPYSGATSAETDLLAAGLDKGVGKSTKAVRAKPPKGELAKAPVFAGYAQAPGKRCGSKPPEIEDFSKTTTPMPDGAASMFGEDSSAAQRRGPGRSRPRSSSRGTLTNSASKGDLESPSSTVSAVDPLGSSMGKRRFGGRG
mmetsp:Transcript_91482/g.218037  ORF Transcript_91482/g.218037 Transcript_91482/m.218037 type:complete len:199 (+) Transcript_91482:48-644(+)|eukprot:CAMPEP_0181454448 /NCGR_PEP_ID=MMETSP1110-20121109/30242_1 /TAXON_ID=174948 /ORGANISM="Symbiodinium sp., Strain CCMP421" /LENGTH=198 /DNA_ID=CAMNT_0023578791 /DNA_START=45 /DNA_END=641 /DNA_ORIENTATION=+